MYSISDFGFRNAERTDFGMRISDFSILYSAIRIPISDGPQSKMGRVMDKEKMKQRTKEFALRVIRLVESLPKGRTASVIGGQLLRAGTSVGANYRVACRAKSTADFISKMGTIRFRNADFGFRN